MEVEPYAFRLADKAEEQTRVRVQLLIHFHAQEVLGAVTCRPSGAGTKVDCITGETFLRGKTSITRLT